MQVLLRENVAKLGKRGDVVTVKDGYARNFLMPKGMAVLVKHGDLKSVELEMKRLKKVAEREHMEMAALVEKLSTVSLTITARANAEGHLFGSVGPREVAEALAGTVGGVPEAAIRLEPHIKDLGAYDVHVHMSPEFETTIKVWVVNEEQPKEQPAA